MIAMLDLFYAFCSGAFGAMMGASGAFVVTGCMCAIGMAALFGSPDSGFIHNCVTFGPMLLPAVTFAGGAAAAHYARKRGYVPYGEGRNINRALLNLQHPDVILFGGAIGALGYAVSMGMNGLGLGRMLDTSATAIVLIALALKVCFDREILGTPDEPTRKLGRFHPDSPCWQRPLTRAFDKTLYGGLIGGMASCCVAQVLASENAAFAQYGIFLPFAVSCLVLLLNLGGTQAPVTHHITLCAAYAMANGGGNIAWGILAAIIATFAADHLGRAFHMHGDCYVDPAAMAICVTTPLVQWLLPMTGLYQVWAEGLPWCLIAALLAVTWYIQQEQTDSRSSRTGNLAE